MQRIARAALAGTLAIGLCAWVRPGFAAARAVEDSLPAHAPPVSADSSNLELPRPVLVAGVGAASAEGALPGFTAPPSRTNPPTGVLRRSSTGDSMRVRMELGGVADLTNERFYEDAFIDTTFLGRQQIDSPERRLAGVFYAALEGTRSARGSQYQLENELSIGNLLQRDVLGMRWMTDLSPEWRLITTPSAEVRFDQTYDRDLSELRAQAAVRARRTFLESFRTLDLVVGGDVLRTQGLGADFVLDRNAARAGASLERAGYTGAGWRVGYQLAIRDFPDSTERSHFEHLSELRLRHDRDRGVSWSADANLVRRVTIDVAPTSRDNWWQELGTVEAEWRSAGSWSLRARGEADAMQYTLQDSLLYFNYTTVRLAAGPRVTNAGRWSLWLAPRFERLASPWAPGEDYWETAGQLELEYIGRGALLSATPVAGWRDYAADLLAAAEGIGSLHSSYAFYELTFFYDQQLPGTLRLRALGTARTERHSNSTENGTSLYFSLDVRRLF